MLPPLARQQPLKVHGVRNDMVPVRVPARWLGGFLGEPEGAVGGAQEAVVDFVLDAGAEGGFGAGFGEELGSRGTAGGEEVVECREGLREGDVEWVRDDWFGL